MPRCAHHNGSENIIQVASGDDHQIQMRAYAATAMQCHTYEAQGAEIARTCFTCHHRLRRNKRQARGTLETTAKGRSANKHKKPNRIQHGDAAPKLRKLNGVHVALQADGCPSQCSTRLHKPAELANAANNPSRDTGQKATARNQKNEHGQLHEQ